MADIRPFRALRPACGRAAEVAALPYDVYTREEARAFVENRPYSFLNIDRPETGFPKEQDMYAGEVYAYGKKLLEKWKEEGVFLQDESASYYIYELTMDGRSQTGIGALSSVDDYLSGVCKKHENTVEEKEQDRIRHVDSLSAQTGPIFLSYHGDARINELVEAMKEREALYDFVSEDGIRHRLWRVSDAKEVDELTERFAAIPCTYIADGHHRAASAVKVCLKRRAARREAERNAEFNYFLSVLFPDTELRIYDYNRVVKDLNGLSGTDFLECVKEKFEVTALGSLGEAAVSAESGQERSAQERGTEGKCARGECGQQRKLENVCTAKPETEETAALSAEALRPERKYEMGMYLGGKLYRLKLKDAWIERVKGDAVSDLDVSVLQSFILEPVLGIKDPRTDQRIKFMGGIRGLSALQKEADKTGGVAFAMHPTTMEELFRVADAGRLMPPKSTWFEPKLRSGLLIHLLPE